MGAFNGSVSYKLFFVQGDLPAEWKTTYLERIQHHAFEPLEPHDEEEEAIGWVPIERPLGSEFPLISVVYNDFINLGLRRDRYAISNDLFKAQYAEVARAYMKENELERLTKFQRDDLKTMVRRQLKEQTLPTMKVIDMSWELTTMRVRFWSQSNKMCEIFQGLFEDTFNMKLLPANPYTQAIQQDLDSELVETLSVVEPSNFVDGTTGLA